MKKYKLDVTRDVDIHPDGYLFCLPFGYRFYDDLVHTRSFDTLADLRAAAKTDVVPCICRECAPAAEPFSAAANLKGA